MSEPTKTWPELAIGLYEALTETKAEITDHIEDMKVEVPSGTGTEAEHAIWKLDGKLRVSTKTTPIHLPPQDSVFGRPGLIESVVANPVLKSKLTEK